ncbi:MAG: 3-oxoacyl-[acyl-carrier-protein] reductase [Parachlamydiaceae bacterium]|nr:3-oxoacyl-[acyl-carrier-protein] reductase [Parachlamydiaceae bacterium]
MKDLLLNQVAVVTGATAGIGKAIALKFALSGAKVILIGTNVDRGETAVSEIHEAVPGSTAEFFQVDVADHEAVRVTMKDILSKYGTVDILVNNAGITKDRLLVRMSEIDWDSVMDVNAKSCYNTCHALLLPMMKARKGKIINMSSVVGLTGNPAQTNYAASKAAVIGFTKALAKEVASRNICVNCLAPGFIVTPMTDALTEAQKEGILSRIPLARLGDVEDVANAALFLASSLSGYITGTVISVDGGMALGG